MRNIDVESKFVARFQEKEELFQHVAAIRSCKKNGLVRRQTVISIV